MKKENILEEMLDIYKIQLNRIKMELYYIKRIVEESILAHPEIYKRLKQIENEISENLRDMLNQAVNPILSRQIKYLIHEYEKLLK